MIDNPTPELVTAEQADALRAELTVLYKASKFQAARDVMVVHCEPALRTVIALHEALAAANARADAAEARVAVRVKPLVFEGGQAESILGRFRVECSPHGVWFVTAPWPNAPAAMKSYKSEFAATEALQADYAARITAALETGAGDE